MDLPVIQPIHDLKNEISLIVNSEHPRLKYERRGWEKKKTIRHWGQRKLLLSEMLFLTRWGDLSKKIVYAGAAPGCHITFLSLLFPTHKFILVDPNPFKIPENENIQIINGYFTDELAATFKEENVLFISDIRTADWRQMDPAQNEEFIIKDNNSQINWIQLMQPAKSMLKFRCPYADVVRGKTKMYRGDIILQVWPPASSSETRLIVDDILEIVEYDNLEYEEQLFYHNNINRYKKYQQPVKGEGLDDNFDSSAEVIIIAEFLEKFPEYCRGDNILDSISKFSYQISRQITDSKRTLATRMTNPENRRQFPQIDHTVFYSDNQSQLTKGNKKKYCKKNNNNQTYKNNNNQTNKNKNMETKKI